MKTGNVADRVVSGQDLSEFYSTGIYTFDLSLYYADSNSPRILCDEFYDFGENIETEVSDAGSSLFYLRPLTEGEKGLKQSFKTGRTYGTGYEMGHREYEKDRYESIAFVYTISGVMSMMSGEGKIAFTGENQKPAEKNIRTMSVCLW